MALFQKLQRTVCKLTRPVVQKANTTELAQSEEDEETCDYAVALQNCLIGLANEVYGVADPRDISGRVLRQACDFYDADWCGLFDVDRMLKLLVPFWWYNRTTGGMTKTKLDEGGVYGDFTRWMDALNTNTPIYVDDIEKIKDSNPEEYAVYSKQEVRSILAVPYAADFDRLANVAKTLGGKAVTGDGNHRNYLFPGKVAVEFHPNLLHHATPIGTGINPGWQYAKKNSPTCSWELTEEGFYLNTICHLANHFVAGGVGVRFVLDVWVNRYLRKPEANRAFVEAELTRFGLLEFTQKIEQLADGWFGDAPMTPLLEELGEYILTSGSHGTTDRAMLNALSLSPGGNRFSALMKKAFYPRAELEDRFPWCKGKPLLLPAAWCARAYNAVTQHGSIIVNWSKGTGKISKTEVIENQKMLRSFGIHKTSKQK